MAKKVLVAFASKYGATGQIAEKIALRLRKAGLEADVRDAGTLEDISGYSAAVIGSGVYAGQWLKPAAAFLRRHADKLAQMPVWLFSGGPLGEGDPVELVKGWQFPQSLQPVADQIKPKDINLFHGALEMDKLRFAEKLIVRALKANPGDFRDWDTIHEWADGIAEELKE